MKTPGKATRMRQEKAAPAPPGRVAAVLPWGAPLGRVIVEQASKLGASVVRQTLKARVKEEHPEGKAMARKRYFSQQRGLPGSRAADVEHVGKLTPRAVRTARARIATA